ncbi:MAG: DNA-directed RNA polymerase [Acidilobaceae archaeon]|nr:DNA-directed RNA polymerase [Acidilobaceae archaeon]
MAEREEESLEVLPYGIRPVPVHYVCVSCGKIVSAEELVTLPSLMCPNCGQRIFAKLRAPRASGHLKKVKAI